MGLGSRVVIRMCTEGARPHRGAGFDVRFKANLLPPTSVGGTPFAHRRPDAGAEKEHLRRIVNPDDGEHERAGPPVEIIEAFVPQVHRDEHRAEGEERRADEGAQGGFPPGDGHLGHHAKEGAEEREGEGDRGALVERPQQPWHRAGAVQERDQRRRPRRRPRVAERWEARRSRPRPEATLPPRPPSRERRAFVSQHGRDDDSCREKRPSKLADDPALAQTLWAKSEEWVAG
jgi:hypothetical protein